MEALKARVEDVEFIPSAMQRLVLGSTTLTTGKAPTYLYCATLFSITHRRPHSHCLPDMHAVRHVLG